MSYFLNALYPIILPMTHSNSSAQKPISPLYCAVNNGHINACILLLEHGVNLSHICSGRAMMVAIEHGYTDICRLLLDYDMNPNGEMDNFTYIHYSIRHNHIDIVELLLDTGACMGIYKNYVPPLTYAAYCQCYDIIILLKKRTAIYDAVVNRNDTICKLLLSRGAVISSDHLRIDDEDGTKDLNEDLERAYFLIDIMDSMRR